MIRLVLFLISFSFFTQALAQFTVKGKVTDAQTSDPIPFASILLKGTSIGISTDFEGNYLIQARLLPDSIVVSYLGYINAAKVLSRETDQTINFQLKPSDFELEAFVFEAGENPAF